MTQRIQIKVSGHPAPQGSKRHVGNGVMVESSKKVKPWREAVVRAAREAMGGDAPLDGPLRLSVRFFMPRPQSHYRANGELKPWAPVYVDRQPDLSKLIRSTEDALTTAGLWSDDARVAAVLALKRYCGRERWTGAVIEVRELEVTS